MASPPISKRTRFEIFERDGFICQYCGKKPPGIVLEVDHIDPRSNGGTNDDLNLVTSCFDCNRGKGAKVLKAMAARPDADLKYLRSAQELVEARRFIKTQKLLEKAQEEIVGSIQKHWLKTLDTNEKCPNEKVILQWLSWFSPEEVIHGISCSASAINRRPWSFPGFENYVRYVSGVMKNRRDREKESA